MDLIQLVKNENYRMREFNGEYYLFGESNCFKVNRIGKIVWLAIGKDMQQSELIEKICEKFDDTEYEEVQKDVSEFINSLIEVRAVSSAN